MKAVCRLAAVAAFFAGSAASAQQLAPSPTLDAIKARGHIECGVHLGLPGFSFANDKGEWTGPRRRLLQGAGRRGAGRRHQGQVHPDLGAAALGRAQSGQVDLLSRNTTITLLAQRHAGRELPGHQLLRGPDLRGAHQGQGRRGQGPGRRHDLRRRRLDRGEDGRRLVRERNLKVTIITAYDQGRCDAYTAGIGALAGQRIKFKDPNEHQILTEIISNDPQGPVTRWGDERWQLIVRWVLTAPSPPRRWA